MPRTIWIKNAPSIHSGNRRLSGYSRFETFSSFTQPCRWFRSVANDTRIINQLLVRNTSCSSYRRSHRVYSHNSSTDVTKKRFAVIGGGFAGVAVSWHLLQFAKEHSSVHVDLFDAFGLGSGGSGAAAGLLHPYNPRGKLLWHGLNAFEDALELVQVAEDSVRLTEKYRQFVWRHGLLRPSKSEKHSKYFSKATNKGKQEHFDVDTPVEHAGRSVQPAQPLNKRDCHRLVPGLVDIDFDPAGFWFPQGVVLQPLDYLTALWEGCQSESSYRTARFHKRAIHSLEELQKNKEHGESYDAIVVAAGAALHSIEEIPDDLLSSLDLCQGFSLDMIHQSENDDTVRMGDGPSLLGSPYIAFHGSNRAVVGATQRHNISPEESWDLLGPKGIQQNPYILTDLGHVNASDIRENAQKLKAGAASMLPSMNSWEIEKIRSGVRAIPPLNSLGALPMAGRLPSSSEHNNWWIVTGLGSRGLVYHAWLGKLLAYSIWYRTEDNLPQELVRWKQ